MIFSYNWLKDYVKKLPRPEKLAELLGVHSFEVEEIKKVGGDYALNINVRPNRAGDCFSHWGIARECGAITSSKFQVLSSKFHEDKNLKAKDFVKIEVKSQRACPRYTARVLINVKIGPSPKYIQERLKLCGLQPINNIVDIANYVMLETGQPLHAFDVKKLKGSKIIVRFAKKGEKITTLDDQKFNLDKNILVIADAKNPVAIAGIKGGRSPSIDKKTKIVVLESANFEPKVIRKGTKLLNLRTDASWRFEHGIDPNLTEIAIDRTAQLIQEIAGGKIAQGRVDFYPRKVKPKKIKLDLDYVERLLGVKIPKNKIVKILKSLEFKIPKVGPSCLMVGVPSFRLDISIPEDLIEEIGRIYGYEKIPAVLPRASVAPPERNLEIFWEEFSKDALKEVGFTEVYNYSFISEDQRKLFGFKKKELLEIENPLSLEYQYLRPSLTPYLLKNVKDNFRYFDEIRIFEMGKIFRGPKIQEKRILSGLIAQKKKNDKMFYELKGVVDTLLEKMAISDYWYDQYQPTPEQSRMSVWHKSRSAEIKVGQKEIGFLGEISPRVLANLKIKGNLVLFEIDFNILQNLASEEHEYQPVSPYPAAVRDLAVLIPRNTKMVEVFNVINQAGGELIRDVDVFDIYEGEEIPIGKKNLAFHLIYQAKDRTLTAKEIDKVHNKIIRALEKNMRWEVRR